MIRDSKGEIEAEKIVPEKNVSPGNKRKSQRKEVAEINRPLLLMPEKVVYRTKVDTRGETSLYDK